MRGKIRPEHPGNDEGCILDCDICQGPILGDSRRSRFVKMEQSAPNRIPIMTPGEQGNFWVSKEIFKEVWKVDMLRKINREVV